MVLKKRYLWMAALIGAVGIGLAFLPDPDIAVLNAPPSNGRILMLGDSMTAGIGASRGNDLPAQLGRRIGREVVNAGVSGETARGALERLNRALFGRPGIVIVFLGGNDRLQKNPLSEVESSLARIIQEAQNSGSMVVLVGFEGTPGDGYGDMFKRLSQTHGCLLVPDALDGIFLNPKLKADALHPNDEGYALIADRIAKRLRPYLAER